MPAPLATVMQQLVKTKFMSFQLRVPPRWRNPIGQIDEQHFRDAFENWEKSMTPGMPPLFITATANRYHVEAQKMHIAKVGQFIDNFCDAITSAWGQWQKMASFQGIVVNAVTASGGQLVGPPLDQLIKNNPIWATASAANKRYMGVMAKVLGQGWQQLTSSVKFPGLPLFPAFAAFPGPVAPPTPNVPVPFAALTQVPVSIGSFMTKAKMVLELADKNAPFSALLFEAITHAFEQVYNTWKLSTMVTNVLGTGPIPTFAPPYVPVGPVVGGTAFMAPGGLI